MPQTTDTLVLEDASVRGIKLSRGVAMTVGEPMSVADAQLSLPCVSPDTLDRIVLATLVIAIGIVVAMAAFGALSSAYLLKSFAGVDLLPGPSPFHVLYEAFI